MKLFIWDFHGVLEVGTENAVVEISNKALEEFGYNQRLTLVDCEKFYGLKWFEYFEKVLPGATHKEHINLQNRCFQISDADPGIVAKCIKQNEHAEVVLKAIAESHHQILIPNTHQKALNTFVKALKFERFFCKKDIFAADAHKDGIKKTKKDILTHYLENAPVEYDEFISIGDSEGDIALLKGFPNSKTYLYAHPKRKHRKVDATYKIRDLRDILKEL
jgi:phosphoglycolate phosphatase-like HAD superfamily hydrolase